MEIHLEGHETLMYKSRVGDCDTGLESREYYTNGDVGCPDGFVQGQGRGTYKPPVTFIAARGSLSKHRRYEQR